MTYSSRIADIGIANKLLDNNIILTKRFPSIRITSPQNFSIPSRNIQIPMTIITQIKVELRHSAKTIFNLEKILVLRVAIDMSRRVIVDVTATVHLVGWASDKVG